ncbi:MAG: bacteriohemerythrin [Nitrospirota bacterium]|nr:bacteriohemerythrin [Nitrospirota bacterium]
MALIEWSTVYSVGVKEFDAEHKRLIEITNTLYDAMMEGKGHEVLEEVLESLSEYTDLHFAHEEMVLKKKKFPGAFAHKLEHEAIIAKLDELKKEVLAGSSVATTQKCASFLRNWLTSHIQASDKEYGAFLVDTVKS